MNDAHSKDSGLYIEGKPKWELDVVCGMDVDPRTTPFHHTYKGKTYYFCIKSCLEHFTNNPRHYLLMKQHHLNVRKTHHIS